MSPTIEWTREKWAALEGLAKEFGLSIDVENAIHLQEGPERKEIASIHEIGVENDICIIPGYNRGKELLEAIGSRIFGARTSP
ncbi:MAG: hypothetical protein ACE5JJ_09210 [Nitrospinota bacterium]